MRTDARSMLAALLLVACNPPITPFATSPDVGPVDAFRPDSTVTLRDAGPRDTGATDVGSAIDAALDAPPFDASLDAGPRPQIVLDGAFTDPFWGAVSSQPATATTTGTVFDGDALTTLHYGRDADFLYLGFEGSLVTGDAAVIYVDTLGGTGVPLNGGLNDFDGAVNRVLSLSLTSAAEFQPEWGWGTSTMPRSIATSDRTIGWRRLAASPSTFTIWAPGEQSACSMTGCETAISLAELGVPTSGAINLVVRLGRPGVGFSNQTFPTFDASTPELVSTPIAVPLPP